jgi:hypothetical protein
VNRLIVPVNADDASRVATNAIFLLLYGTEPPHPIYGQYTFAARAREHSLELPLVHLVVGNRLTQYEGPAKAFGAMSDATSESLFESFRQSPKRFTQPRGAVTNLAEFREEFSIPLRDFNTSGVVAAHLGTPLSKMQAKVYGLYSWKCEVKAPRLKECRDAVDDVVKRI